MHKESEK